MPRGVYPRKQGWVPASRKILPEMDADVQRRYLAGETQPEIALAIGCGRKAVARSLRRTMTSTAGRKSNRGSKNGQWKGGRTMDNDGYVLIHCPSHPNCEAHGYVREHRLVAESILGRLLLKGEVVHHKNSNKADNRPENLEVFSSNGEHLRHELTGRTPQWTEAGYQRMLASAARKRKPQS